MKNTIALLSLILLVITSCSPDDNNSDTQEIKTLPKRVIAEEVGDTYTYIYNGNKILKIIDSNDDEIIYTYTNDLITEITTYEGTTVLSTDEYSYENNKLKSAIYTEYSTNSSATATTAYKSKKTYTHNSNGTITEEKYIIDPKTAVETKSNDVRTYTFENGNLTKIIYSSFDSNQTISYNHTDVYEYDTMKNPFTNILSFEKIEFGENTSSNNVVKRTTSHESFTNGVADPVFAPTITNYTLSYDTHGYLSESKHTVTYTTTPTVFTNQYFYE